LKAKSILKKIKLAEPTISTLFGFFVVLFVGFLIFKYFQGIGKTQLEKVGLKEEVTEEKPGAEGILKNLPTTYEVKQGDYLWKIALEFYESGYNWVDIAKENNLENPSKIFVGSQLKIPEAKKRVPFSKISPNLSVITGEEYKVIKGDNLWSIALRTYGDGYRWTEIAKVNNLKNPNLIHPGNTLKLPR